MFASKHKSNNSKLEEGLNYKNSKKGLHLFRSELAIFSICLVFGFLFLVLALQLGPSISGRLHPSIVPFGLAILALATCVVGLLAPSKEGTRAGCEASSEAASARSIGASAMAVTVLALGVQPLGLTVAVFVAGTVGAFGTSGIHFGRAVLIGAGLSLGSCAIFVIGLRQPWPIWPTWIVSN